jgi:hypothetical protein
MRAACPAAAVLLSRVLRSDVVCTYRRCMNRSPESTVRQRDEGPSLLSRIAIAFALVSAGVGVAVLMAAG